MQKTVCDICGRRIRPIENYWNITSDADLYTDDNELLVDREEEGNFQICMDCHRAIEESEDGGKINKDLRKEPRNEKIRALLKALMALGLVSAKKDYNALEEEEEE